MLESGDMFLHVALCIYFQIVVNLKLLMEVTESENGGAPSLYRVTKKQRCATMPLCVDCVINAGSHDTLGS